MTTDDTHSLGECLKRWRLQKGLPLEVIALKTRIPLKYLLALEHNNFSSLPPIQTSHATLGDSLREFRQQRGLSLEAIAERTRIPPLYLQALEENDPLNLPAVLVVARSYVHAYLDCLSLQEEQEYDVMLQFAKLVEAVYIRPPQKPAKQPIQRGSFGHQWASQAIQAVTLAGRNLGVRASTFRKGSQERARAIYIRFVQGSTRLCRRTASAGRTVLACTRQGVDYANGVAATAGRTAVDALSTYAARLLQNSRIGGKQPAVWHQVLTAGAWQIRHSFIFMHRDTGPLSNRYPARDQAASTGEFTPEQSGSVTIPFTQSMGAKMWVWLVQYGITILLLLLLGSVAANIALFKETALPETKLDASHLVEFLGYSGALVMVWLIGRKAAAQLDRDRTGFSFLRPLVPPLTALVVTSAAYKVLLVLLSPFLDKTDRLTYNWIFVGLCVASTLWLILAWFLKSAPMLESLEAAGRAKQPTGDTTTLTCLHCGTSVPAKMKFCGHCGVALASSQD
ncbi:MAG: helix-turn-helix domain-containing protein [Nitrospiraceae bacterium]